MHTLASFAQAKSHLRTCVASSTLTPLQLAAILHGRDPKLLAAGTESCYLLDAGTDAWSPPAKQPYLLKAALLVQRLRLLVRLHSLPL